MDNKNLNLTHWHDWIEVIATARYIVNNTAPGDSCYMSEDCIEAMKCLAKLTSIETSYMADALAKAIKAEKDIEEVLQRRAEAAL